MATTRPASGTLPTIMCSNCRGQVSMDELPYHVCSSSDCPGSPPESTFNSMMASAASRRPPPLNLIGMNRPPVPRKSSAHDQRPSSPSSLSRMSIKSSRSNTNPLPNHNHQSSRPGLMNLDSAFPPFPVKRKQSATKDVNYYGPLSPSLHAGGSVLKRMNTIAPGPFGVDRRRTNSKGGSRPGTAMSDRSCGSPPALPISIHSSQPSVADGLSQSPENSQSLPALEKSASQVVDPPTVHISRFNERSNTFPSIDQDSKPDQLIDTHDSDSVAQSFGKPAHFSGESQSSAGSADTSERQTSSSRSTPPLNEFPALMPEGQSMVSDSVDQLMEKLRMRDAALSERRPSKISRDEGMPLTASIIPEIVSPDDLKKQSICDSPVDPHIQPTPRIEDPLVPQLPSTTFVKQLATTPKAPPVPVEESAPLQRRKTTGRRKCRGCDQVIIGKSIASADGRLTGRYHKACFSCKQCKSPFETATFYVHDNHPYCGRHYHELNGSLCKKCDDGIEGQYLETGQAQKFHQGCFTCDDCQKPLQDDYYELGGKALCETHAFRPMHQTSLLGPGRRHPERRTTRLMMMPP